MTNHYCEPEMEVIRLEESLKVACLLSQGEDNTEENWQDIG